jgi:hypothetical protein
MLNVIVVTPLHFVDGINYSTLWLQAQTPLRQMLMNATTSFIYVQGILKLFSAAFQHPTYSLNELSYSPNAV